MKQCFGCAVAGNLPELRRPWVRLVWVSVACLFLGVPSAGWSGVFPVQAQWWPWQRRQYEQQRYYQQWPQQERSRRGGSVRRGEEGSGEEGQPSRKASKSTGAASKTSHTKSGSKSSSASLHGANPSGHSEGAKNTSSSLLKMRDELSSDIINLDAVPASLSRRDGYVSIVWSENDSLTSIAKVSSMSQTTLLEFNNMVREDLDEGQALRVPEPDALSSSAQVAQNLPRAFSPERQMQREVTRGIRGRKQIALTFDAGGTKDGVDELLSNLEEAHAAATFFVTGEFAKDHPEIVKRFAQMGFPVHNHSWSHPEFTKIPDEEILRELEATEKKVRELTGKSTKPYWRPPFGERDSRVLRVAGQAGYQSIYWTLDSLDSFGEKKDAQFIIDRVMHPPKSGDNPDHFLDGAIILMHVGEPETAAAVPEVIRALRERGFELVTVDDLLKP